MENKGFEDKVICRKYYSNGGKLWKDTKRHTTPSTLPQYDFLNTILGPATNDVYRNCISGRKQLILGCKLKLEGAATESGDGSGRVEEGKNERVPVRLTR